ncbi:MAG: hypothetical protein FJZ01_21580 [Candidatus Sericytochromatia bacterium]|nr:hypothetical protein [Candidatus Tanganyikabacteria bacterium]
MAFYASLICEGLSMDSSGALAPRNAAARSRLVAGTLVFLVTAVAGLAFIKWLPSYKKGLAAISNQTLGSSIVLGGEGAAPPAAGLEAAWHYALAYFSAIWPAMLLALLLGATIQVLVPRRWIHRLFSRRDFRTVAIAGTLSLGGML